MFWAKDPSHNEVLNDMNGNLTNFYMQLKTNFHELQKLIHGTLHSEILHKQTSEIYDDKNADPLLRAWALWVQCNLSFSFIIQGGYAFGTTGMGFGTKNKRDRFTEAFAKRIESVEIFNRDAIDLIKLKDHEDTFYYIDPPYVSSNCGHYDGYTTENFIELLEVLKNIKGKFLMSSYPEEALMKYRDELGWGFQDIQQTVMVSGKREGKKMKTECLTYNYQIPNQQISLFDAVEPIVLEEEESGIIEDKIQEISSLNP